MSDARPAAPGRLRRTEARFPNDRPLAGRPTLLVLDAEPLPRLGRLTGRVRIEHVDDSALARRLPFADVLLVWDFTSRAVLDAWPGEGPRPRWVHAASAGVDHLLCPELAASDTVVTNARGVFERPVAEYVAALSSRWPRTCPGLGPAAGTPVAAS